MVYVSGINIDDRNSMQEVEPFLDSTGCNKMIMIVTDGATETALNVFQTRNWYPNYNSTCHPIEVCSKCDMKENDARQINDFHFLSRHVSLLT